MTKFLCSGIKLNYIVLFITILSCSCFEGVGGLRCFICGTQTESSSAGSMMPDPCWEMDPFHKTDEGKCGPDHLCTKFITYEGDQVKSVMRGCNPRETAGGRSHQIGCNVPAFPMQEEQHSEESRTAYCFCDTDLCNKSSVVFPDHMYLVLLVTTVTLLWLNCCININS